MSFDLDAYLARVAMPARPTIDAEGLARLQRSHRLAIPFEGLDIALGRGIAIDGPSVFDKLVTRRRGGYCFEHNRLFADALGALGFACRPVLARGWLGAQSVPPLTHALTLVSIEGTQWVADAGFGGSYAPVMQLVDGAEATAPDGARFRLTRDAEFGWLLLRDGPSATTDGRGGGPGFERQYSFTEQPVWPADLALSNHWMSTSTESRFVRHRIVSIVLPTGFASLMDRRYRRRAGDSTSEGEIDDPRIYRMRLSLMFGIDLTVDEVAALGLF